MKFDRYPYVRKEKKKSYLHFDLVLLDECGEWVLLIIRKIGESKVI
jgi:hypothetical protein